jgi:hypothetical protein
MDVYRLPQAKGLFLTLRGFESTEIHIERQGVGSGRRRRPEEYGEILITTKASRQDIPVRVRFLLVVGQRHRGFHQRGLAYLVFAWVSILSSL